jgi:16S rRNA (guanine966-N2)-methyltransferase
MMAAVKSAKPPRRKPPKTSPTAPEPVPAGRQSVRIVGGSWRGRRIGFPDLPGLRPTPDRVRETLFNWLQQDVADARCLDLFAGSGALGLEALSRGAREVVFVDQAVAVSHSLRAELARLGGTARAQIVQMGAKRYLTTSAAPFDLVFVDPPFGQQALPVYLPMLAQGAWVKPGGLVYLECERAAGAPALPAGWEMLKSKSAGEVGYHLARGKASP